MFYKYLIWNLPNVQQLLKAEKHKCNNLCQNAICYKINQDTLTTSKSDAPQSFEVRFLRENNYFGGSSVHYQVKKKNYQVSRRPDGLTYQGPQDFE